MNLLTRREWFATSATVLGAGAGPESQPLGFSLYGMKSLPIGEAIKTSASIGYDGVELALMPGYASEPKRLSAAARKDLRKQLSDSGMKLHGVMENLAEPAKEVEHAKNLDRLKAAAELIHALAPDSPPAIETILGGNPADWEKVKDRLVERLGDWAVLAKSSKTTIAVKPHVGNALHTPDAAVWLLKQVNSPWLRLAFDFSHFMLRSYKLEEAAEKLLPYTAFIHVKDAKGTPEKFEFLLPGEHGIDYAAFAKLLAEAKYRGPVVVEVSGMISNRPGYDPIATARKSYSNLAAAFDRKSKD